MADRSGIITINGKPLTLTGTEVKIGQKAPDFTVYDHNLQPVRLSAYSGKVIILSAVHSLDTSVCDLETRKFNQAAAGLSPEIAILTISKDLPFAQKRWCGAAGIDKVVTLSDYRDGGFGPAYGILIKELGLLARCVFVLDKQGVIRDIQLVKEVTHEPDYDVVLTAAKNLV